ncbi:MAG: Gldg family protein [Leptolyngbyaceae cyanobacterium bins.302]|nr:Gldg family protein [Leptolyngbyaceae cyanobacterium bins.302]
MKRLSSLNLKYLFWLGPMLTIAGISAGVVAGWTAVPIGMMAIGVAIIAAWLFQQGRKADTKSFLGARSTQVGTNAVLTTLAVVIILGLLNFLVARTPARVDLTENQVFTLAPETQQVVRNLPQPVKVWVFVPQPEPQDRELLESYRRLGDPGGISKAARITYEFVDPQAQPSLAKRLEIKSPGDVIVESPEKNRKQFVQTLSMGASENPAETGQRLSEVKLTSALEQLTSDRRQTVYFVQGHGERPLEPGQGALSEAAKLLGDRSFDSKPLVLASTKEVPKDAGVVVIAGTQKPLLPAEITTLKNYLTRGGNLLLMVDPTETNLGFESLLKDWGVDLDKRVVVDSSAQGLAGLGPADAIVTQYGDHPISKELQGNLSFYSLARPLGVAEAKDVKLTPFLFTSDRSWAESDLKSDPLQYDQGKDQQGPLVLGVALTRPGKQKSAESRLVVIGNSTFATDGYLNQVVNGDVFLNSVRWLGKSDQQTLSIRPKEAKNRRITLSPQQATIAGWLALVILPILGFSSAFYIWWRRR